MSKSEEPFIGPRRETSQEAAMRYLGDYKDVFATSGLAIVLAMVVKGVLHMETIQTGSIKKILQSFAVIAVAGGAIHEAKRMKKL